MKPAGPGCSFGQAVISPSGPCWTQETSLSVCGASSQFCTDPELRTGVATYIHWLMSGSNVGVRAKDPTWDEIQSRLHRIFVRKTVTRSEGCLPSPALGQPPSVDPWTSSSHVCHWPTSTSCTALVRWLTGLGRSGHEPTKPSSIDVVAL